MAAKDTVMSDAQIAGFMEKLWNNPASSVRLVKLVGKIQYENGREAGIKEVVEEAEKDMPCIKDSIRWQAKLKEWGI